MVWYGVFAPLTVEGLAPVLTHLKDITPGETLVWRYVKASSPELELAALLARFEARFGSPPLGLVPDRE